MGKKVKGEIVANSFDYSELPTNAKSKLIAIAGYLKQSHEKTTEEMVDQAIWFAEARDHLEGSFDIWVESETPFTREWARQMVNSYFLFKDRDQFAKRLESSSIKALSYLARDTVPDDKRKKCLGYKGRLTEKIARAICQPVGQKSHANVGGTDEPGDKVCPLCRGAGKVPQLITVSDLKIPTSLDTPKVRKALSDWMEYKQIKRKAYKSGVWLSNYIKDFDTAEGLIKAIRTAIGNGYDGFFPGGKNGPVRDHRTISEMLDE